MHGPSTDDENAIIEELRAAGAPTEIVDAYLAERNDQFEVLPQNWSAVCWFLDVSDLWRWRSKNICSGMDWLQVEAEARLAQRPTDERDFKKLKTLAAEAARLINHHLNAS